MNWIKKLFCIRSPEEERKAGFDYAIKEISKGFGSKETIEMLEAQSCGLDGPSNFERGISDALRNYP